MKLAYRLLLIVGHTLGDFALPLMRRQCAKVGGSMETLTAAQAERMLPSLEGVLEAYLARPGDIKPIVHELRLEIGAERFARSEVVPSRAAAKAPRAVPRETPLAKAPLGTRPAHPPARRVPGRLPP